VVVVDDEDEPDFGREDFSVDFLMGVLEMLEPAALVAPCAKDGDVPVVILEKGEPASMQDDPGF